MNQKIIFPKEFIWGAATAAYQIEGSKNADGKGESIWDRFSYKPGSIANDDTGDIACDHFNRIEEDVRLMKEMGLRSYRFSIAWTRILPEGKGQVNNKGIDFYKRLIELLLENGIIPNVTLYHWDLPQKLQDIGGWTNRDVTDYYRDYVSIILKEYADLVPIWCTHNEPYVVTFMGHWSGVHAPGIRDLKKALQAAHHILLSHGKGLQVFREMNLKSEIGIVFNLSPVYPASGSLEDQLAAERHDAYCNKWFTQPLFKGTYPDAAVACYSEHGLMPDVRDGDMKLIQAPVDYLGVNYYSRNLVRYVDWNWPLQTGVIQTIEEKTAMGWEYFPEGLYDILKQVHDDYPECKKIMITENGAAYNDEVRDDGSINDDQRLRFLKDHLRQLHRAAEEGINIKGYYVWSLMDNFEWAEGFAKRFGLTYVDYETQKRTIKKSGYWYRDVMDNNGFDL